MAHGCFISYKKEDKKYLKNIAARLEELNIPCSYLDETINSDNIDTVISVLRTQYMNNKPVTLLLIGEHSYEDTIARWNRINGPFVKHQEYNEQSFIIREVRATLSDYDGNPRHGVVGIVLPEMKEKIYKGTITCDHCGATVNVVYLTDATVIREFHENYYLKKNGDGCNHFGPDERYCILCTYEEFLNNPNVYIDEAYDKSKSPLADEVHYKDIKHDYKLRDE